MPRPLVSMSYAVQWLIHGDQIKWPYHVVNWLLHGINVALLFAWGRRRGLRLPGATLMAVTHSQNRTAGTTTDDIAINDTVKGILYNARGDNLTDDLVGLSAVAVHQLKRWPA